MQRDESHAMGHIHRIGNTLDMHEKARLPPSVEVMLHFGQPPNSKFSHTVVLKITDRAPAFKWVGLMVNRRSKEVIFAEDKSILDEPDAEDKSILNESTVVGEWNAYCIASKAEHMCILPNFVLQAVNDIDVRNQDLLTHQHLLKSKPLELTFALASKGKSIF